MVFVEKKQRNARTYYYLAKPYRQNEKVKKKRVFLGTDLNNEQLNKLIADAKIILGEIDFDNILSKNEIKELNGLANKLKKTITTFEPKQFYEHFITEFTYDSNAIEGSSLTLKETNDVLFEGLSPKNKSLKHVQEAKNHKQAFDFVMALKQKKLNPKVICKIQGIVIKDTLEEHLKKFEGNFRAHNVRVGVHIPPPYYTVPRKLGALIKWFNANCKKYHPVIVASYFHSEFEKIHPFIDGNGRTGRLLINFMLKNESFPLITIFLKYRFEYYGALEQSQSHENLRPLIEIIKKCYQDMLTIYSAKENTAKMH